MVGAALQAAWPELVVAFDTLSTAGDRHQDVAVSEIGVQGVFTAELEAALADGRIDLAVHSLKDVPTATSGDALLAIAARVDPRDVLICREAPGEEDPWSGLQGGASVGTSSLRRTALLRAVRPDLVATPLRGNVDTRLARLEAGDYDAILLAAAGVSRLGIEPRGRRPLSLDAWLPAPGQGALAIEGRPADAEVRALVAPIEDPASRAATTAERALMRRLEGGCQVPIGAVATLADGELSLRGGVYSVEGRPPVTGQLQGPVEEAAELGERLAAQLVEAGAGALIDEVRD